MGVALTCKTGVGGNSEACCVSEGLKTWHGRVSVEKRRVQSCLFCTVLVLKVGLVDLSDSYLVT